MTTISPTKKPVETYTYIFADQKGKTIDCFKSPDNRQTVCKLWAVSAPTAVHDRALIEATEHINAVINRLEKGNRDKSRYVSFVQHRNQLLLVWAGKGRIGPDDDFKTIKRALKIRK